MDKEKGKDSPDLLSAALDESGITSENDPAALNDKEFMRNFQENVPKTQQAENYMQMTHAWNPATFAFNPAMMEYAAKFPFMDKNFASRMRPDMFTNPAIMQMALQNQILNGFAGYPYNIGGKDFNPYFMNGDAAYRSMMMGPAPQRAEPEEEAEDEEELLQAESYADCMPSKLKIGIRHPDPVVETNSLSSVQPPEVWYNLSIP
ncbi:hypothetical protein AVEN_178151-1 [Araneus ventricosus]|uniref:Uncharacterized protein n=1 Tax=Araneus ventricosus TaxID=182803 RepID=A0A4Y2GCF3_ARAVE|nr:hypothetical protein AVEN_178151-1 [Araneus ventricosus]